MGRHHKEAGEVHKGHKSKRHHREKDDSSKDKSKSAESSKREHKHEKRAKDSDRKSSKKNKVSVAIKPEPVTPESPPVKVKREVPDESPSRSSKRRRSGEHKSEVERPSEHSALPMSTSSSTSPKKELEAKRSRSEAAGSSGRGSTGPSPFTLPFELTPLSELDILGDLTDIVDEKPSNPAAMRNQLSSAKNGNSSGTFDPLLGITSRKGRTAVYAGSSRNANTVTEVQTLLDSCIRTMMNNVDKITDLFPAPYHLIKPVLAKCTTAQLSRIEEYNDYLIEEMDELWEDQCKAEFKNEFPDDEQGETWRELFVRATNERNKRLKKITSSIKKTTEAKAAPVRKTVKMESFASGRMKNGRAQYSVATDPSTSNASRVSSAFVKDTIHKARMATQSKEFKKPTKAPLMAKTLQMMKNRFRR